MNSPAREDQQTTEIFSVNKGSFWFQIEIPPGLVLNHSFVIASISANRLVEMWTCEWVQSRFPFLSFIFDGGSLRGPADHNRLINLFRKDFCTMFAGKRPFLCTAAIRSHHLLLINASILPLVFRFPPCFYHEISFQAQFPLILHLTFFYHSPHPHPPHPLWWRPCAMCKWDEIKSGNSASHNKRTHTLHTLIHSRMLCA